jgi:hypothetical protein
MYHRSSFADGKFYRFIMTPQHMPPGIDIPRIYPVERSLQFTFSVGITIHGWVIPYMLESIYNDGPLPFLSRHAWWRSAV